MKKYILLLLIALGMLLSSCNTEGSGIFLQISKEIEQISSDISELSVHQIVEADSKLYARTGAKVWVKTGKGKWSDISKGNFIYNIVEKSNVLYGVINNSDANLNTGKIMSYNTATNTWILEDEYNADITLLEANDTFILIKRISGIFSTFSSADPSLPIISDKNISKRILDVAAITFANGLLISDSSIYGTDFSGVLTALTPTFVGAVSGKYRGLATDGTKFFFTTSSGQIYSGTAASFNLEGTIGDEPVSGSLEVVNIDGTDFLIIGTLNGYYEMNISTSNISTPSETTSIDEFDTSYPELSLELVSEVYASSETNTFYLSTSNGLWKRNTDGKFSKQ